MSFAFAPALLALLLGAGSGPALTAATADACPVSPRHVTLHHPLSASRAAVAAGRLTVLAIGSSSIQGVGASRPDLAFTPRLQAELARRLPGVAITVVNRGVGGETTRQTVDRLAREVAAARPDLVIWQLGTNDILQSRPIDDIFADFRRGEAVLARASVDVLLVDPQRLPEATENPNYRGKNPPLADIARLIGLEGGRLGYAVMRRFDAMGEWTAMEHGGVGPDDLHLNDAGYACWAALTAEGLVDGLR